MNQRQHREYSSLVTNDIIEDHSLRYSPVHFRKWSEFTVFNTAIGSISFLALEAIGASLAISYGFQNAFWGILVASILIFILGAPICYYVAKHNIDIDLLTRAAGFGYLGSTVTSLIYASFCFIFFALEAAIMAQALYLYIDLPLSAGYVLSSLVIIPIVYFGMTAISRLQVFTQPIWLILMIAPFVMVLMKDPDIMGHMINFSSSTTGSSDFSWELFGISLGISLSLIAQIGEQADYLRFMPDKTKGNRFKWWLAVIFAGPGWTILGFLKQVGGILLAAIVLIGGASLIEAREPIHMYNAAYKFVFENPEVALFTSFIFVIVSQIKINVTNAYAGSLAWSNFFSRSTHTHLGRAVWVIFNIAIALMLMLMGVFDVLEKILGLYSNVAIAWIAAIFADLVINKPLGLCPPVIEFKRAYLFNINPVGCFSTLVASVLSIIAFSGVLGHELQAFSSIIALITALILSPLICYLTKGNYYIARQADAFEYGRHLCGICDAEHSAPDMAVCPMHATSICSLCCSVDGRCHDMCKPEEEFDIKSKVIDWIGNVSAGRIQPERISRITGFLVVFFGLLLTASFLLWTSYIVQVEGIDPSIIETISKTYLNIFYLLALILFVGSWLIVLMQESHAYAEAERQQAEDTLKESEARFQTVLDNMPTAVYLRDRDGRYSLINKAYREIFKVAREEVQGKTLGDLLPPGQAQEFLDQDRKMIEQDRVVEFETVIDEEDRFQVLNTIKFPIRDLDGNITAVGGVDVDITERREAERRLNDAYTVISSSVQYASNIQRALLPVEGFQADGISDQFIIWEPRDVVGGDIYWWLPWGSGHLIICADCTGHGVPGAFMTLIASAALDRAQESGIPGRTGQLISRIHQLVQITLKQNTETGNSDDGLELGVCYLDLEESRLTFSGARFSLFVIDDNGVEEIKGDKSGIGYRRIPLSQTFTDHEVDLVPSAQYYLTTDGLIDQVGGERRRMFGKKRFTALLQETRHLPMAEQKTCIEKALEEYQGEEERRDDVTVIGFKIA